MARTHDIKSPNDFRRAVSSRNHELYVEGKRYDETESYRHLEAPEEVWHELLDDEGLSFYYKIQLGSMQTLPASVVRRLADEEDWLIRLWAVERDDVPEDVLRKLADDWNFTIRSHVACHPDTPHDVLKAMAAQDEHWRIRDFAQRNLDGEDLRTKDATES